MGDQIKVIKKGNSAITISSVGVYSFDVSAANVHKSLLFVSMPARKLPLHKNDFDIIPYGNDNRYPEMIKEILENNHLAKRVIERHVEILWGSGPMLFRIKFVNGKRVKTWHEDSEIQNWLSSWDYIQYLQKAAIDYHTYRIHFTKVYCGRYNLRHNGDRIPVDKLENIPVERARFEWPDNDKVIRNIITCESQDNIYGGLQRYPVSYNLDSGSQSESIAFSMQSSFALETEYPRSSIHSTINWISTSSMVPVILASLNMNAAAIKYHVKVPALYWINQKDRLEKECMSKGVCYQDKMLEDLKDETFSKITATLSGIENAGKMLTTEEFYDATAGIYTGWAIEVLDQKVKDFIDAQINIAKHSDIEVTAGLGMHPALSNVSEIIGLSKGSELFYTHKLYQFTGVDIPESIVTREINRAIAMNFRGTDLRLGFFR